MCYNVTSADVAQLVEQLIRNEQVTGSIPAIGSKFGLKAAYAAFFLPRSVNNRASARENTT